MQIADKISDRIQGGKQFSGFKINSQGMVDFKGNKRKAKKRLKDGWTTEDLMFIEDEDVDLNVGKKKNGFSDDKLDGFFMVSGDLDYLRSQKNRIFLLNPSLENMKKSKKRKKNNNKSSSKKIKKSKSKIKKKETSENKKDLSKNKVNTSISLKNKNIENEKNIKTIDKGQKEIKKIEKRINNDFSEKLINKPLAIIPEIQKNKDLQNNISKIAENNIDKTINFDNTQKIIKKITTLNNFSDIKIPKITQIINNNINNDNKTQIISSTGKVL